MQRNTLGLVHEFLRRHVKEGDFCIDATAGRGRDTALLCRLTGERGTVLAFDIQREAVEDRAASARLGRQSSRISASLQQPQARTVMWRQVQRSSMAAGAKSHLMRAGEELTARNSTPGR